MNPMGGPSAAQSPARPSARRVWLLEAAALALGVLSLVGGATLPIGSPARSLLGVLLFLLLVAALVLTGREARRAQLRPSLQAALAGLSYAVPSGLATVLFPPRLTALLSELRRSHASAYQLQNAALSNTPAAHWSQFVIGVVVFTALGFLAGWAGSLFGPRRHETGAM